jgi:universal stress protein E
MSTFAHILAATDLTGRSVYALQRALQIKAESNCQLSVLHVVEHGLTPGLRQRHYEAALANLEDWKQSLPVAQQLGLDVRVLFGDPFATILAMLESEQIELAVVGSPGKNEMKGLFTGTTAERVIRFSPAAPVLMVRQHAAGAYSRALVAVDFSPSAKQALYWAGRIAPDAEIRLAHAWQPAVRDTMNQDRANQRLRDQEERHLQNIVNQVPATSGKPIDMIEGDPHDTIRKALGGLNAELLVMGTHGRGRLAAALLGSVAHAFLATGPCDVMVVRE